MCCHMIWILRCTVFLLVSLTMLGADSGKLDYSLAKTDVNHPDIFLKLSQILVRNGYPMETHHVLTEDGYLLAVHHIPQHTPDVSKVVVIFRCLYCTSYVYFMLGPHRALGYLLADAGYDVWFAEMRGNSYSKSHVILKNDQSSFWNFSWHEMGVFDIPAVLDYVTNKTGADTVLSIGYSMGTTAMFVTGAMRPKYMSKIRLFIALAPVGYCAHVSGMAGLLGSILTPEVMNLIPDKPMLPDEGIQLMRLLGQTLCGTYLSATVICKTVFSVFGGNDFAYLNTTMFPVIAAHFPDQDSVKTLFHFMQGVSSGKFRQYDYGKARNLQVYGTTTPPEYDLSRITAPVALIWSTGDPLATAQDVRRLATRLPNVVYQQEVVDNNFSHLDFVFGNNAPERIYSHVMELLEKWPGPGSALSNVA